MEMTPSQSLNTGTGVPPRIRPGLLLLQDAYYYATELEQDIWDFAVEIESLHSAGLTKSDFRWLVCKGFVEHARETTCNGDDGRAFQPTANLSFTKRSCFVLTQAGKSVLEGMNGVSADTPVWRNGQTTAGTNGRPYRLHADQSIDAVNGHRRSRSERPNWDGERHELRFGEKLVKVFKLPSPNQETILMAFEEEAWPPRIDDPLPLVPEIDPKRRLHDTLKSLNRNQKQRLIRFMGDGTGEGVRWEPIA